MNAGGTVPVRGTILAGNTGGDYVGATVTDNGYNLVGTATGGATFSGTGTQTGVTNPQLGPLADNGGSTQTRPPLPGSPAVNAGAATCNVTYTDAVTMMPVTLTADQRGVPRPQGAKCDIGAVEARLAVVVNNTGDGAADGTRCNDPAASMCRLRDAVAATDAGGTITFATPLFAMPQTITLDPAQGQLPLSRDVTITGRGADMLAVARNTAGGTPQFRIFLVNSGVTATISGLTITGGDVHYGGNDGGGILSYGTLAISDAAVTNNFAGANGGGIQHSGSALTVTNSTFSDNSAYNNGGGIGLSGGTSTLTNVTVSNNGSSRGSGIALNSGTSTLINVTASGNNAVASGGGGIYNNGTLNATRTIVADNTNGDFYATGFNGTNTANLTSGDPKLASLGNYGGPTQTRPPLPGSPALDTGGSCTGTDQRGVSRPQGSACDIGAVEIRGYSLAPVAGSTPQTASVGTTFAQPLAVTLTETGSSPLPGAAVTFTAPGSGASGVFGTAAGCTNSAMNTVAICTANGSGIATSPTITANLTAGMYTATATAAGAATGATFALTNTRPTIAPATLPNGVVGGMYSQTLTASGGTAPYTFTVTPMMGQQLPPGLTLDTSGTLFGTPTMAGTFTFTVTATDSGMNTGTKQYTVTVNATPTITTTSLPDGAAGVAYRQTLATSGGTAPLAFAVTAGSLPVGMRLNATTGTISGTPVTAGMVTFTVTVTDANGATATRQLALTVAASSPAPQPTPRVVPTAQGTVPAVMPQRHGATAPPAGAPTPRPAPPAH